MQVQLHHAEIRPNGKSNALNLDLSQEPQGLEELRSNRNRKIANQSLFVNALEL